MKAMLKIFLKEIIEDKMLIVIIFAPFLYLLLFKIGVPYLEDILVTKYSKPIIEPYYIFFDLTLAMLTTFLLCFVSALVVLEEFDVKVSTALSITPVTKKGYIASRLIYPTIIAFIYSIIITILGNLTNLSIVTTILINIQSALLSVIASLIIVSFSKNRVEGMATAKLAGIVMVGIAVPFILKGSIQYIFSLLPSFWIGKMVQTNNYLLSLIGIISSLFWIVILYERFQKRIDY